MSLGESWGWLKIDRFNRDILKTSLSLVFNASYAVFNLALAWIYQSEWYLMMAAFLAPLCIIRFRILIFWKKDGHGILFFSGIILLLLDMQIAAIVYVSSIRQVTKGHGEIIMITVAAYTFTKLGFAIVRAVNARKDSRPIPRTIRCITYAEVAASLLSLQRSMIVSFGNLLGKLIMGRLTDKMGKERFFICCEIFIFVALALLSFTSSIAAISSLALVLGFFTKGTVPITSTMIAESVKKENLDTAYSINSLSTSIANTVAPLFFGMVADVIGIQFIFIACGATAICATVPAAIIIQKRREKSPSF